MMFLGKDENRVGKTPSGNGQEWVDGVLERDKGSQSAERQRDAKRVWASPNRGSKNSRK